MFLRALLTLLLIYAPVICLRFCELRAYVVGQAHVPSVTFIAARHASGSSSPDDKQIPTAGQHVPLNELRDMLVALTEYCTPNTSIDFRMHNWQLRQHSEPMLIDQILETNKPPPRLRAF